MPGTEQDLAPKIARHGADEDKHGRIFTALLRKRGLQAIPVPEDTNYTMLLERRGIGLAHHRLRDDSPLSEQDVIAYLAHSRVTEQRASEQMRALRKYSAGRDDISRAVRVISADEDNHLAYCHEELLRLAADGHAETIEQALRTAARAEIAVYRTVSKAVMAQLAHLLDWPTWKLVAIGIGIDAVYLSERIYRWRRMVTLRTPARRNPLGVPTVAGHHDRQQLWRPDPATSRHPG